MTNTVRHRHLQLCPKVKVIGLYEKYISDQLLYCAKRTITAAFIDYSVSMFSFNWWLKRLWFQNGNRPNNFWQIWYVWLQGRTAVHVLVFFCPENGSFIFFCDIFSLNSVKQVGGGVLLATKPNLISDTLLISGTDFDFSKILCGIFLQCTPPMFRVWKFILN